MSTYKKMEEVLKLINQKYISLETEEVRYNNKLLKLTVETLIRIIKSQDSLFGKILERLYFGGSYYDDLKVGKPDAFDICLIFVLPKVCEAHKTKNCECLTMLPSDVSGFCLFEVKKGFCSGLDKFIKDGYMQTNLILNWMESKITLALNEWDIYSSDDYIFEKPTYFSESGQSFTLRVNGDFGPIKVKLVPAFQFGPEDWPNAGFRPNETAKSDFFIVPSKLTGVYNSERYWRPSFEDQERELIEDMQRLKPSLRLLKKMRTNLVHTSISSYALKTIVLWETEETINWNSTLSDTFMSLLKQYRNNLKAQRVPYYWHEKQNLLDGIHTDTLVNHHNEIARKISIIDTEFMRNPCIVAKVILKEGTEEYKNFIREYNRSVVFSTIRSYCDHEGANTEGYSSAGTSLQTTTDSGSGWATAGIFAGAAALVGIGIFAAVTHNNRNQNN